MTKIKLTFADARLWRYALRAISELAEIAGLKLDESGARIAAMDPSHVALIDFRIPREAFDEYEVPEPTTIVFNLEDAAKVLRRATKTDSLGIKADESKICFALISKGGVERQFIMPQIAQEVEEVPELELEFPVTARVLGASFATAISVLGEVGESLKLRAESESFKMVGISDLGEAEIVFSTLAGTLIDYSPSSETIEATYTLEYFEEASKVARLADAVSVMFGPDIPCKLVMELSSGARLIMYVAPRSE